MACLLARGLLGGSPCQDPLTLEHASLCRFACPSWLAVLLLSSGFAASAPLDSRNCWSHRRISWRPLWPVSRAFRAPLLPPLAFPWPPKTCRTREYLARMLLHSCRPPSATSTMLTATRPIAISTGSTLTIRGMSACFFHLSCRFSLVNIAMTTAVDSCFSPLFSLTIRESLGPAGFGLSTLVCQAA